MGSGGKTIAEGESAGNGVRSRGGAGTPARQQQGEVRAPDESVAIEVDTGLSPEAYTTVTLGGEIGYRLFVWEGLYVCPVIRYWPNVWSSAPDGLALSTAAGDWQHDPMEQGYSGLFANVLIGWDFDLSGASRSRR